MLPSIEELIAKGYGRTMTVGGFSTGIVGGGAGTVLDLDQPEFVVGVPAGFAIRPFRVEIVVNGGLGTTDLDETEALLAVDTEAVCQLLSAETCTIENPKNMRTDILQGSICRTASAFSADMETINRVGTSADPVLGMELARIVEHFDAAGTAATVAYRQTKLLYDPDYPPFLVGPSTLIGYWGGTRATIDGFAIVCWVEGPAELLLGSGRAAV